MSPPFQCDSSVVIRSLGLTARRGVELVSIQIFMKTHKVQLTDHVTLEFQNRKLRTHPSFPSQAYSFSLSSFIVS
jgi:hypothetical protein